MKKKILDFLNFKKGIKLNSLAGSLSFFFVLTILPLLFIVSILINKFSLITHLNVTFSFELTTAQYTGFTLIFILSTIVSISKIFKELRLCGEDIYSSKKETTSGIKGYLLTIAYGVVFILIIAALSILYSLFNLIDLPIYNVVKTLINQLLSILIIITIVYTLNHMSTPKKVPFKSLIKGVLISTILMYIATFIYFNVLNHSNMNTICGALAGIVILLSYIYLIVKVLIFGIILNAYIVKNKNLEYK